MSFSLDFLKTGSVKNDEHLTNDKWVYSSEIHQEQTADVKLKRAQVDNFEKWVKNTRLSKHKEAISEAEEASSQCLTWWYDNVIVCLFLGLTSY